MKRLFLPFLLNFAIPSTGYGASISIYISPPSIQNSEVTGTTVATFDSLAPGNLTTPYASPIGTYAATTAAPFHINAADQFGGAIDPANPTTPTNYFTFGAQSSSSTAVSLKLNQSADYFGFWWSAGDANNGVSFYIGNFLLLRFTTQVLLNLLNGGAGKVTALSGAKYNTSAYYGNPNGTNQNTGEPYVFIDLVAKGLSFDRVVFDNSGTTASGFESDNHTVKYTVAAISTDHVYVGDLTTDTPEPPGSALIAGGLLAIAAGRRLKRRALRTH